MLGRKPQWLKSGKHLINLDKVKSFENKSDGVGVFFIDGGIEVLKNVTLDDIHYYLKHGKPRKRQPHITRKGGRL